MSLNDIVQNLYQDRRVNEFINRLQPADLRDDLKQHCFLEIYRMEARHPGKVESLHQANQLWAWFHGMVRMQLTSEKTTFYRLFRRTMAGEEAIDFNRPEWPDMDLESQQMKQIDQKFVNYVYSIIEADEKPKKEPAKQISLFT